jgi:hypothetical protein
LLQEVKTFIEQDPAHRNPKYWIHWRWTSLLLIIIL